MVKQQSDLTDGVERYTDYANGVVVYVGYGHDGGVTSIETVEMED